MGQILIGDGANPHTSQAVATYTWVNKGGPANGNGIITSVEIFAVVDHDLVACIVGIFYLTNGNTLKCRSAQAIGAVVGGAKRTFPAEGAYAMAVKTGDFIGIYDSTGWVERKTVGESGIWGIPTQEIDVGDEAEYTFYDGDTVSVYGIGEEVAVGAAGGSAALVEAGII